MKKEFEVYCYESEDGQICLEFGDAGVSFSKDRFVEFSESLNRVRHEIMLENIDAEHAPRPVLARTRSRNEV